MVVPFIDFHTHRRRENTSIIEVVSLHHQQDRPYDYCTVGFHPWWTKRPLDDQEIKSLKDKYMDDAGCLAIGECGLDKLKGADLDTQEAILIQQVNLANALSSPVIIHCVRSFERILDIKKYHAKTPWVIHGFVRNKILAKQVLDAGILLSVAPNEAMSDNFIQTLKYLPTDSLFLETDSDDRWSIVKRYEIMAALCDYDMESLKIKIFNNFTEIFKHKWKYPNG